MYKLSFNISRDNERLGNSIIDFNQYVEFLKNSNKVFGEEIYSIRNEYLKPEKCEEYKSLRIKVTCLYETLEKVTKGKNKVDIILSNQIT